MMSDLISRNAVIQKLNTMDRYVSEELILCETDERFPKNEVFIVDDVYEEIVENLPSAETERKKGKWILHENQSQEEVDNGNYLYVCSECGKSDIHAKTQEVPFCWWCGSEMREEYYDQ